MTTEKKAGGDLRLEILPPAQRALWEELGAMPPGFVLYGGTAIALWLGHRQSEDFDFFSNAEFSPRELQGSAAFLKGAEVIQSGANTLTCLVHRGGPVKVSFFGGLDLNRAGQPLAAQGIWLASLVDLMATKLAVLGERAAAKDYLDIDALLKAGVNLVEGLGAAQAVYGARFNPLISLKALTFFGEGDLHRLDAAIQTRLAASARGVDPRKLPVVGARKGLLPA